jgi:hypothetical protein
MDWSNFRTNCPEVGSVFNLFFNCIYRDIIRDIIRDILETFIDDNGIMD